MEEARQSSPPPSRREVLRGVAAVVGAVAAAAGASGCGGGLLDGPGAEETRATGRPGGADAGSADRAVEAALRSRAAAYERGDRADWVGTSAVPVATGAAREDEAAYDVMRAMGIRRVEYGGATLVDGVLASELRYAVAGFDIAPASAVTHWEPTTLPPRRRDPPVFPWEEPGAVGRRGEKAVAVGVGAEATSDLWLLAERAVDPVRRITGRRGLGAVVVMPAGAETFARWAALTGPVTGVPAATVGPIADGRAIGCDRIVVNPALWSDLSPAGRRVVLTHEVTHVWLRREGGPERPAWLDEGFCEYVAYADEPLAEAAVAAPLIRQVRRRGVVPGALPDVLADDVLPEGAAPIGPQARAGAGAGAGAGTPSRTPSGTGVEGRPPTDEAMAYDDRAAAYAAGLLACRIIAERSGEAALVRLALTASDVRSSAAGLLDPLRQLTGWDLSDLRTAWATRVRALASGTGP